MTPAVAFAKVPDDLLPLLVESPLLEVDPSVEVEPVELEPAGVELDGPLSVEEPVVIELELPRGRFPITLKVTVNGSLLGLVNFKLRAPETSLADKALSEPSRVL